jgi:hypothetical protein
MNNQEQRVKDKLELLSGVHSRYMRLQKAVDSALDLGLLDIDGELLDSLWDFQSHMMVGEDLQWLSWYILDNDNGENEGLVEWDGGSMEIKSLSDLATMLVTWEIQTESN